jgi:hypothetical protein
MMAARMVASAALVALGAFPMKAAVAAVIPAAREGEAMVTSLAVVPTAGAAEVVIKVSGAVTFNHFTLSKPDKIVVDMNGATLGLATRDVYDGVARGGIKGIRYSQFTKTVVRVVITLDGPRKYGVLQEKGELRVNVDGQ